MRVYTAIASFPSLLPAAALAIVLSAPGPAYAGGGPLGIDHRLSYDDSGIWARHDQLLLEDGVIVTELGAGLWLGGDDRLGKTFWQSIDASVFGAATAQGLKYAFGRERPSQTDDPNQWSKGGQSFPSGEVTLQASFVTPLILEYREDHPWIWALEALPAYDSVARMKTWGHWQTDVLAAWGIGTAWGVYAHGREMPFFLSVMPHGVMLGWHTSF
ncbi:MAG: phosphatase PAP2 family protein [Gammaproteobacteria bacterium]